MPYFFTVFLRVYAVYSRYFNIFDVKHTPYLVHMSYKNSRDKLYIYLKYKCIDTIIVVIKYKGDKIAMTFIEEAVTGEFFGKAFDSIVDISKNKIKKAVENRNVKYQNCESQIYSKAVDVLNKITCSQYENEQDKIYDAAEKILNGFKNKGNDNIEIVKSGLSYICEYVDKNKCEEFIELLYQELSREEYMELYREIRLFQQERANDKSTRIEKKVDVVIQKVDDIKNNEEKVANVDDENSIFQNDKKRDYLKNWNSRLFLDVDNDENPTFLANVFIMPDFKIVKRLDRKKFSENNKMEVMISEFIKSYGNFTMLIAGVPGIGKSSIVSWMANKYKYDSRIIMLRFRDWKKNILKKSILNAICNELNCKEEDLNHRILVLDGFDEMKALKNRKELLNNFFRDIQTFENFKCIITSRLGYIENIFFFHNVFVLKEFNISKVDMFMKKVAGKNLTEKEKIELNLEVLGIPVILYMAIMADIKIGKNPTKPELYNCIFAETGGIFDKFNFEGIGYDMGNQILRDIDNIKIYLNFLREVAFKMFEKDNLELLKEEYTIPELNFKKKSIKIMEFPIKNLFENTEEKIEFIHKSIYEYFTSEHVFVSLQSVINQDKEKIAGMLGKLFNSNILSLEILEFLKYKINNSELKNTFQIINVTFQLMLQVGMTHKTGIPYENVIDCEINVFTNMLKLLNLWEGEVIKFDKEFTIFLKYLRYTMVNSNDGMVDLKGMCLKEMNLSGENLCEMNLSEANLTKANLTNTNLINANLYKAILKGADLRKANLSGINLEEADLEETIFGVGQIRDLEYEHKYNLRKTIVYIDSTSELISYKEYCRRKH